MNDILVIAGPTASGKSARALTIAQELAQQNKKSTIINADSQQLYRELPVLSEHPGAQEMALVPHKLYSILNGWEPSSAGHWLRLAKMEIDWALSMGQVPIVVGGTGLYLKALMEGLAEIPEIDPAIRTQASNDFESMGKEDFSVRLREIDPAFFERLAVYDKQRLIRAFAVWLGTGKTLSWWQAQETKPAYAPERFRLEVIDLRREELYARCDERFAQMLERGALDEVEALMVMKLADDLPVMKTLGYRELASYLRGEIKLDEAVQKAQQATRNYAKRQVTWFQRQISATTLRSGRRPGFPGSS